MHQGDTEQNSPGHRLILATRLIEKQGTSDIEQVTDVYKSYGSSWLTFVKDPHADAMFLLLHANEYGSRKLTSPQPANGFIQLPHLGLAMFVHHFF